MELGPTSHKSIGLGFRVYGLGSRSGFRYSGNILGLPQRSMYPNGYIPLNLYLYREYFKAKVYTIWVDGPSGFGL